MNMKVTNLSNVYFIHVHTIRYRPFQRRLVSWHYY